MSTFTEAWGVLTGLRKSAMESNMAYLNHAETNRMTEGADVLKFALAGNSTFTIVSKKTANRFTYKVRVSEDGKLFFVKVLTGNDNENDFTFLGTIWSDSRRFRRGNRSPISEGAPSAQAFAWFWSKLLTGALPSTLDFHHEGRCGRCGRKLTVPESIRTGLGPECASKGGA